MKGCTLRDRSTCQFLKLAASIGLLAPEARFKVGVGEVGASAGFTGAASASVAWGADGVAATGGLSAGVSADAKATVAGFGSSASVGCSMTTNRSGGCAGGIKTQAADATYASSGAVGLGIAFGPGKIEVEVNVADLVVSTIGEAIDAARNFVGTLTFLQGVTSDGQLRLR